MKRTIAYGGLVATAGLLAASLVTPAQADVPNDVASVPLASTGIAARNIAAFWLAEDAANLINATPYNVETKAVATKLKSVVPAGDDGKPGIVGSSGDAKPSTAVSKNVNLPRTTGKVFFADGFKNTGSWQRPKWVAVNPHWCTATSVQSAYKNVVATAGHCVYDTTANKTTLKYWVFVPGYYQGKVPWGLYVGKQAFTHYDYDVYEDGDRDYGFVTVYNGVKVNGGTDDRSADLTKTEVTKAVWDAYVANHQWFLLAGQSGGKYYVWKFTDVGRLGANVGGQGIAYNQKVGGKVFVFGYPSGSHPDGDHAFSGKTLKWSYGSTARFQALDRKAEDAIGVRSSFTGEGSLGSAWLLKYSNVKRLGYLNGVTQGVADTDGNGRYDTSISSYFDGELFGVYSAAKNLWSGSIA
jgi:hypothetical protein